MISGWERGRNLGEVLGLEAALNSPWTDEIPTYLPTEQAKAFLEGSNDPSLFDRIARLGVLRPEGDRCVVSSPQLLSRVVELVGRGFKLVDLISLHERIAPAIDDIARQMVEAGAARLFEEHGEAWLPRAGEVGDVAALLQRLRQLAMSSAQLMLGHAMEHHVADVMGDHLARVIKQNVADGTSG